MGNGVAATNYLYDGTNLLEEIDSSGNVLARARYTQTTNPDEPLSKLLSGTTNCCYQQLRRRRYRFARFHDVHRSEMNTQRESLSVVVRELGVDDPSPRTDRIPKARIEQFMSHDDIEVLGAAYAFITDERRSNVIEPPLQFEDHYRFLTHYYERCFREDPKSKWADSRYSAGHDLVNWFVSLWNDKQSVPK